MTGIQTIAGALNQPNGIAGLDANGNLVGTLICRQGTAAQIATTLLQQGELATTTDTKRVYLGDGVTVGGTPVGAGFSSQTFTPVVGVPLILPDPLATDSSIFYKINASTGSSASAQAVTLPSSTKAGQVLRILHLLGTRSCMYTTGASVYTTVGGQIENATASNTISAPLRGSNYYLLVLVGTGDSGSWFLEQTSLSDADVQGWAANSN